MKASIMHNPIKSVLSVIKKRRPNRSNREEENYFSNVTMAIIQ